MELEEFLKKLRSLKQELVTSQRYNYASTRSNVKTFNECVVELDELLDEFENEITK